MPDTFSSLRTRLDTPTSIERPSLLAVIKLQTSFLFNVFSPELFTISFDIDPLNLRLTKRRELWLISPFYGWDMILGPIFFFLIFRKTWLSKRRELWSSLYFLWAIVFILWNCSFELCERGRWPILWKNWDKRYELILNLNHKHIEIRIIEEPGKLIFKNNNI